MTEYHTVYKGPEGETTQWDDIQAKRGNLPEKEAVWKPEGYAAEEEEQRGEASFLDQQGEEELEALEDEYADDRFMEEYRRKRLEELRRGVERPRYGTLEAIRASEYKEKVTDAPQGVWVVCHLYKDSLQDCAILNQCLAELAPRHPNTRFVKIVGPECIPGYPDDNLPTVLLYRDTKCLQTLVGLRAFGGRSTSPDLVAMKLNTYGDVCGDNDEQRQQVMRVLGQLLDKREEERQQQQEDEAASDGE